MTHAHILNQIDWKDLVYLSKSEIFIENTLSLPWIIGAWICFYYQQWIVGAVLDGFFFLAALRQVHNGFHNALGLNSKATNWVMYIHSVLMLVSVHSVMFNHLRHHKYCMQEKDYEGRAGKMSALGAILYGPIHIFHIHKITFQKASTAFLKYVWMDVFCIILFIGFIFWSDLTFLKIHLLIMFFAELLMAFFAVWTVHHDAHELPMVARTQRTKWKNFISMNMFYHMEHHLFPGVPTIKLPELARRLDQALPELRKKQTF